MKNQQKRCRCDSIKHLRISSKDCHVGLAIRKAKNLALETAASKLEAKKSAEDATAEEESKCMAAEAAGEGIKSDEGAPAGYVVYLDAEAVRQLRMGIGWLCCFVEKSDRIGWLDFV